MTYLPTSAAGGTPGNRALRAAAWLLVVSAGCFLLVLGVHQVFVHTVRGQLVESAALDGARIGRRHIIEVVHQVLSVVSISALAVAAATIGVVALLRRRFVLAAVALGTVLGSNLTTQVLKHFLLDRPNLGVATQGISTANTLPSGHTTVAMSVAVAAILVVPARMRAVVVLLAAAYGCATGVATLSAGYHRPSDAIAACLVVGGWAAGLAALAVVVAGDSQPPAGATLTAGHPYVATLLGGAAGIFLFGGALGTYATARSLPETLAEAQLLLAYGGGAGLIIGTALAVVSALVVVVHRIAPPQLTDQAAGQVDVTTEPRPV